MGAHNARAARRLPTVINATLDEAGIRTGSVPAVGLFDVLEHIEDDRAFVRHLTDIVQPGGMLYLTVPSFNWLWSTADIEAMHFRRYTKRTLADALADGFDVLYSTYLFERLVPLFTLMRVLPYRTGLSRSQKAHSYEREHAVGSKWLADVFARILGHEIASIATGKSLLVGSSLLAIARRREQ